MAYTAPHRLAGVPVITPANIASVVPGAYLTEAGLEQTEAREAFVAPFRRLRVKVAALALSAAVAVLFAANALRAVLA